MPALLRAPPILLPAPLLALSGCGSLERMLLDPPTPPEQWCTTRPCLELGGVVVDQPLGSCLVLLLAVLWLTAGARFWRSRGVEKSRFWWACALVLGGVAAGLAGASYQAFGYELKCAGRPLCLWTSWFELGYVVLQSASTNCMVAAVAHSCATGRMRGLLVKYAWGNAATHLLLTIYGLVTARSFLLSFELLLLFSAPALATALLWNGARFLRHRTSLDLALLGAWLGILAVTSCYGVYSMGSYAELLRESGSGLFLTENDVLHLGMIGWILYVTFVVFARVTDHAGFPAHALTGHRDVSPSDPRATRDRSSPYDR